jgi:hypothetical protein
MRPLLQTHGMHGLGTRQVDLPDSTFARCGAVDPTVNRQVSRPRWAFSRDGVDAITDIGAFRSIREIPLILADGKLYSYNENDSA